jgi:hypothetical protein
VVVSRMYVPRVRGIMSDRSHQAAYHHKTTDCCRITLPIGWSMNEGRTSKSAPPATHRAEGDKPGKCRDIRGRGETATARPHISSWWRSPEPSHCTRIGFNLPLFTKIVAFVYRMGDTTQDACLPSRRGGAGCRIHSKKAAPGLKTSRIRQGGIDRVEHMC